MEDEICSGIITNTETSANFVPYLQKLDAELYPRFEIPVQWDKHYHTFRLIAIIIQCDLSEELIQHVIDKLNGKMICIHDRGNDYCYVHDGTYSRNVQVPKFETLSRFKSHIRICHHYKMRINV